MNSVFVLDIINSLLKIVQSGEIYNSNLSLKSKDFYKILFLSMKLFNDKDVYDKDDINEYIGHIKKERKMLFQNNLEQYLEKLKVKENYY